MYLIKDSVKIGLSISILSIFLLKCTLLNQHKNPDVHQEDGRGVVEHVDHLLKNRRYERAVKVMDAFRSQYPRHAHADDAAYRRAYICVIADSANPFLDYAEARARFEDFKSRFPQSRYHSACNNWLKILNLYFNAKRPILERKQQRNTESIKALRKTISELEGENQKLRKTLSDLEQALQR